VTVDDGQAQAVAPGAPQPSQSSAVDPLDDAHVLQRYKRLLSDAGPEHDRVVKETADYFAAYGLNAIKGRDFADLQKVWGDHPPEIGMMLSNVNTYLGSLITARREPIFPGFNMSPQGEVIGQMLTLLIKAGRRWAKSETAEARALKDLVIVGYAFVELYLETDDRPPYKPQERFLSLDRVWWDPGANESNLTDAQEFVVSHRYSVDEAAARFSDFADLIRAMGQSLGAGNQSAPGEGARALGGPAVSVSVDQDADGKSKPASGKSRRLREIRVDDFQFVHFEELAEVTMPDPQTGQPTKSVVKMADYSAATDQRARKAAAAGQMFKEPEMTPFTQPTWYRARVMADTPSGGAKVVKSAEPIKGNQRLLRAMTGFLELYKDGEKTLRTRFFAFGRVLLGLQRLASVWMRLSVEQEARRNRSGGDIEEDTFASPEAKRTYVDAKAIPGSWPDIPAGAGDKIHPNQDQPPQNIANISEMFNFLSVKLPAHMLGTSDIGRGTFEADRSAKWLATQQETSLQLQFDFTSAFTDYLSEGAVTMGRMMLELLDTPDIDRLLGNQPLREGITGQADPNGGDQLVPIPDPSLPPDPQTGQPQPLTLGAFLKQRVGEVFDKDVGFALRPSVASERNAYAQLLTQHGFFKDLLDAGVPGYLLAPAVLQASFAEGSIFADLAAKLQSFYSQSNQQQAEAAQVQTETGWVNFIQSVGRSDPNKAVQLMQQASQAMTQPPTQTTPPPAPPAGLGQ
jgi:hypothetical protein